MDIHVSSFSLSSKAVSQRAGLGFRCGHQLDVYKCSRTLAVHPALQALQALTALLFRKGLLGVVCRFP